MNASIPTDRDVLPTDLLKGRRILVAGGTGHVGRVVVNALLRAGATAIVPSRSTEKLEALREQEDGIAGERLVTYEGDIADESDGPRIRDTTVARLGGLDGVVASLGGFVAVPSVLEAPASALGAVLEGYVVAHFNVARTMIPSLEERGGSYVFINGPLAFQPLFAGAGLVSIATAAQAMLARVAMMEVESGPVRVNELVLYTSFGREDDAERNIAVGQGDVGFYIANLLSDRAADVRGSTIHLRSLEPLTRLVGARA